MSMNYLGCELSNEVITLTNKGNNVVTINFAIDLTILADHGWLAVDENGEIWLFNYEPNLVDGIYCVDIDEYLDDPIRVGTISTISKKANVDEAIIEL